MSERKVLNKYYPPDFDPSKIPRSKVARNKTFVIRLMAPCNMRCTTCGEYIYKGRKFNARKEDVDDMNHLGLRIYRFYIKCTACLSEISFRTDPANTDYVLEAGATRNFEALAKAEKQAELEHKAYREELESNPMKLLEERTEASKNEMERMEALEELQELNKRTVKVDYDNMLSNYDKLRELAAREEEREDEEYVKSVFGNEPTKGEKVKRILDDGGDDSSGDEAPAKKVAAAACEKPTDLLVTRKPEKSAPNSWDKSIGSMAVGLKKKKGLVGVVVKAKKCCKTEPKDAEKKPAASTSLGLLGQYSDSNSGSSSD